MNRSPGDARHTQIPTVLMELRGMGQSVSCMIADRMGEFAVAAQKVVAEAIEEFDPLKYMKQEARRVIKDQCDAALQRLIVTAVDEALRSSERLRTFVRKEAEKEVETRLSYAVRGQ